MQQFGKRINPSKDITVGERVWIGSKVSVLKGVEIGDSSIVGSGSVVTGKYESNVVIAGNPAKIIKRQIDWISKRIDV